MAKLVTFLGILLSVWAAQAGATDHLDSHFFVLDSAADSILSLRGYSQSDDDTKTPKVLSEVPTLSDACFQKVIQDVWGTFKDPKFIKEKSLIEKDPAIKSVLIYLSFKNDTASPTQATCGGFNKIYYYIAVKTNGDHAGSYSYGFSSLYILNSDAADTARVAGTQALISKMQEARDAGIKQDIKAGFARQN